MELLLYHQRHVESRINIKAFLFIHFSLITLCPLTIPAKANHSYVCTTLSITTICTLLSEVHLSFPPDTSLFFFPQKRISKSDQLPQKHSKTTFFGLDFFFFWVSFYTLNVRFDGFLYWYVGTEKKSEVKRKKIALERAKWS